jgi:hypothetical protein
MNWYNQIYVYVGAGDAFVNVNNNTFGTLANATDGQLQAKTLENPLVITDVSGSTDKVSYDSYIYTYALGCSIPLSGRDLVMGQLMCMESTLGAINSYPHVCKFPTEGLTVLELMMGITNSSAQPGSAMTGALALARSKMKTQKVQVGSLSLDIANPNECRSWWCKIFDKVTTEASNSYKAGNGGSYLLKGVADEILSSMKNFVMQETTTSGMLGNVSEIVKDTVPLLLSV